MGSELVAGKGQDVEIIVLLVKGTQTCVLGGQASLAGDVDNERSFAGEGLEVHSFTGDGLHFKIEEVRHTL